MLTGSISLAHTLIAAGVVDEYRLFVYPAVQGRGRRLFPDGMSMPALTLVEPPKSFPSGITLLRYAQAESGDRATRRGALPEWRSWTSSIRKRRSAGMRIATRRKPNGWTAIGRACCKS